MVYKNVQHRPFSAIPNKVRDRARRQAEDYVERGRFNQLQSFGERADKPGTPTNLLAHQIGARVGHRARPASLGEILHQPTLIVSHVGRGQHFEFV